MDLNSVISPALQISQTYSPQIAIVCGVFLFIFFFGAFLRMMLALCKVVFVVLLGLGVLQWGAAQARPVISELQQSDVTSSISGLSEDLVRQLNGLWATLGQNNMLHNVRYAHLEKH